MPDIDIITMLLQLYYKLTRVVKYITKVIHVFLHYIFQMGLHFILKRTKKDIPDGMPFFVAGAK